MHAGGTENLLLLTDSYKVTHHRQYPPNTKVIYSYFESRGGKYPSTVFFGLQYLIKRWLVGRVITIEKIKEAEALYKAHFGKNLFNKEGWMHIVKEHEGKLPVRIRAVPEGTVVPYKNVLLTIENTDPKCFWLTNYLETLLVQVWYPTTVCTNSYYYKKLIRSYLIETADNLDGLPFKLHDFGFRGSTSVESAGIGGASHLVNFQGTDTIAGIATARTYYSCPMAGFSIPAAEHSTITSWGKDREIDAMKNMLTQFPGGLVACVSDSYDIFKACEQYWGTELKDSVVKHGENGGILVVRPDSGDPSTVLLKVLTILGDKFGFSKNSKGFKMLPPYLRIIQGDGISYDSLKVILAAIKSAGWSTDNLAFGCGGALLQRLDRDTQKCAFKCSFAIVDGTGVNVFKDPITDHGKKSKRGRLTLERRLVKDEVDKEIWEYRTIEEGKGDPKKDVLLTVFENGSLLREWTFDEVRKNSNLPNNSS